MFGVITDRKTLTFNGLSGSVFTATYPCIVYWVATVRPTVSCIVNCVRVSGATSNMQTGFRDSYGCYLELGDRVTVSGYGSQYKIIVLRYS